MKRALRWLVFLPFAIIAIVFAVANRHNVPFVLDPTGLLGDWAMQIQAPLFLIVFVAMMIGVVLGGCATWFGQGKHRRAARDARSDARHARDEVAQARAQFAALPLMSPPSKR